MAVFMVMVYSRLYVTWKQNQILQNGILKGEVHKRKQIMLGRSMNGRFKEYVGGLVIWEETKGKIQEQQYKRENQKRKKVECDYGIPLRSDYCHIKLNVSNWKTATLTERERWWQIGQCVSRLSHLLHSDVQRVTA